MMILLCFTIVNICAYSALSTRKTSFFLEPKNGQNEMHKQRETKRNRQWAHAVFE